MKINSMKKYLLILIGICILIFAFYAKQGKEHIKSVSRKDTIIYRLDGASNTKRLDKFIDNVEKNNIDRINLVQYTVEGDPITTQLYFDRENIEIAIDSSKDKYGGQDSDKIFYKTIKGGSNLKDDLVKYLSDRGF